MHDASPFRKTDIDRVAEFLGGSTRAAYALARDTWLPENVATLKRLKSAVSSGSDDVHFLCDHLREGARSVGAQAYLELADAVWYSYCEGNRGTALRFIDDGLKRTSSIVTWLDERAK